MQIIYTPKAKQYLDFWVRTGNKIILKKILQITSAIIENPFEGIGKPEALKYNLAPKWEHQGQGRYNY